MAYEESNRSAGVIIPPIDELFNLYSGRVYSVCLRMTGNRVDAEDLTQEVFIRLMLKADTFRGESAFTTWLHRLTVNYVLMHFRKRHVRCELVTPDGELPVASASDDCRSSRAPVLDRMVLDEAIAKLAPGFRSVFVLHDIEGLEHWEIAELLGCSVGTSKSQLHKARMKLRSLLSEHMPVERDEKPRLQQEIAKSLFTNKPAFERNS
jgi:RNA polymerase sigma-70 factor (ECF subfamily)